MQKGLINRTWSDHIPALGGINKGWSLLSKLLPNSLPGVCSQCCDLPDCHAEGEQDRLIKQESLYKDKTELNVCPANTSDSLSCILGCPNQQRAAASLEWTLWNPLYWATITYGGGGTSGDSLIYSRVFLLLILDGTSVVQRLQCL